MEIIQHYKNLYSLQDRILDLLVKYDFNLYLTGGTALNRFICSENSRFSDDLDFFTAESTLSARNEIIEFTQVLKENNFAQMAKLNFEKSKNYDGDKLNAERWAFIKKFIDNE